MPVCAILDTPARLQLCAPLIRPLIYASDRDMFDFAVDSHREKLKAEEKMMKSQEKQGGKYDVMFGVICCGCVLLHLLY